VPTEYIGAVMKLCTDRRGIYVKTDYYGSERVMIGFRIPFAEIIFDFHDHLKSATRGYGTMDYEVDRLRASNLVKVRILINRRRGRRAVVPLPQGPVRAAAAARS
jgi:GTP-binding protein LepA